MAARPKRQQPLDRKPPPAFGFVIEQALIERATGGDGDCLEVTARPTTVHVRTSEDRRGPRLALSPRCVDRLRLVRHAGPIPRRSLVQRRNPAPHQSSRDEPAG
ncbi:DUF397 domain-containing protein [Streptomyces sp. NPDC058632]|uniref:DUF397 domain-containing protein n=1 Tax=unclassified Streptomyces TaxID=2593676 RepID=UPI00364E7756